MTEVPPPVPHDPGGYPVYPGAAAPLPGGNFEMWIKRVGAYTLDSIPVALLGGIGSGIADSTATSADCVGDTMGDPMTTGMSYISCQPDYTGMGWAAYILFSLAALVFAVWNWGFKQGTTGSSLGKNLLGIQVVGEDTGLPIGFGMSVVRQLAHFLDALICYIGFLLPLFTSKRQTIADMLVKTVVIPRYN